MRVELPRTFEHSSLIMTHRYFHMAFDQSTAQNRVTPMGRLDVKPMCVPKQRSVRAPVNFLVKCLMPCLAARKQAELPACPTCSGHASLVLILSGDWYMIAP